MRRRRWFALVPALAGLLLGLGPVDAKPPLKTYVALGDSYAAGPLIPAPEEPWGCLKSTNNYPKLLAARLGLELRDATCSGAQTDDMLGSQGVSPEANPPQFERLDRKTSLVTLQIGGNDIGFGGIAETCARAAFAQESCKSQYVDEAGNDELQRRIDETLPLVSAVIQGIHTRSPKARVLVLGYPGIFRIGGEGVPASCPAMGVGEEDARYLRGVQESLNAMIRTAAEANDATYVDVYSTSAGKTACDLPVLRWVEPLAPANAAAPIHPNLNGMLGMSDVIERVLTGSSVQSDLQLPAGSPEPPPVPSPF